MSLTRSNIHCHSCFSDGKNTLEEMTLAAIEKGFVSLGFSEHAWNSYDTDCCMKPDALPIYFGEIQRLRQKYGDHIELYAGLEVDGLSPNPKEGLDFTIGALHYLQDSQGRYHTIDYLPEMFEEAAKWVGGRDTKKLVEQYYATLLDFLAHYQPEVIAHLDLIVKLNGQGQYFNESSRWYQTLVEEVGERVIQLGTVVEVNTGGICRGYRREPYPSREFLQYFIAADLPLLLSSDAHQAETLDFWFDEGEAWLRELGCTKVHRFQGGRFVQVAL